MATNEAGEFEKALAELEAINKRLEEEDVGLDDAVALFKKGKELQRRCEQLLKNAQEAVEAAAAPKIEARDGNAAPQVSGQLPFGR
ncbi:MAG: exodeoxyribonuclease VII small subunit [Candidatus Eremiobacteraeota bacterium]|nr:exodeoxyribonuclease VII small subunit [Candidatus Eremiobacteraeota bacterium]